MKCNEVTNFEFFYKENGKLYQVRRKRVRQEVTWEEFEKVKSECLINDNVAYLLYTEKQVRQLLKEWEAEPKKINLHQLRLFYELTLLSDKDYIAYLTMFGAA